MSGVEVSHLKRKACLRCATAKAKCSVSGTQKTCDRCRRLRRDCVLDEAPRRKKEKQSTRVKALEDKVDSILSLLTPESAVGIPKAAVNSSTTPAPTEDGQSVAFPSPSHLQGPKSTRSSMLDESKGFDVIDSGLLTLSTANALLKTYREVHSKIFPFVPIAPEIDAATLRKDSPFLFLVIVMTGLESDHMLQKRLGVESQKVFCERVLIGNERNIDLLQGLLVRLNWNHFHFNPVQKQTHMFLQMAISLVMDLDLDRCPAHRDQRVGSNLCSVHSNANPLGALPLQCRRTTAEIRALLGCFYLASSMAMVRKEVAMKHTQWVDHCCQLLEVEQEVPTDQYVLALIRARCLAERIGERFSYDDHTFLRSQSDTLIEMSLNGFKKGLGELESSSVFSTAEGNYALLTELKALPITLFEVALYRDQTSTSPSPFYSSQLWDLLTSTREFLEFFISIPNVGLKSLPSAFYYTTSRALIILSTITRLPSTTGWDSVVAKREADFMTIAQRIRQKFGDDLTLTGDNVPIEEKDVWAFFKRGMGGLIGWHQRFETQGEGEVEYDLPITPSGANLPLRCALADLMTPFAAMRVRKPLVSNANISKAIQGPPTADLGAALSGTRFDTQPDMFSSIWDDEVWQSILEDYSMFPTTAAFPPGVAGQH